jgi:hypothetical protein
VRYAIHGIVVDCDYPLDHDVIDAGHQPADMHIRHAGHRVVPAHVSPGRCLQQAATSTHRLYSTVVGDDGTILLRFHGLADFEITPDLRCVQAWTESECPQEMLAILTAGNLIATVLTLRGEAVLHASAVETGGIAIAFVADSGMGKSTLAALACARGARFLTDDVLRYSVSHGRATCWRGATRNRLRRRVSDLSPAYAAIVPRQSVDERMVWAPPRSDVAAAELRAVVLPIPARDRATLRISRIAARQAVFELLRRPRLQGWVDHLALARSLAATADLAGAVAVYRADIPWGPPFAPAVVDELLAAVGLDLT